MYHALLPPETVKTLKTEYRVRFFIVFLFFASLSVLVASFFLLPSYVLSSVAKRSAVSDAQSAKNNIATDTALVTASLRATGSLVTSIDSSLSAPMSPIVLRVVALRPKGIFITSFDVSGGSGKSSSSVVLEGVADTRGDLEAFENILEGDQAFSNVVVPISDLASASNIQFSLQMTASLPRSTPKQ